MRCVRKTTVRKRKTKDTYGVLFRAKPLLFRDYYVTKSGYIVGCVPGILLFFFQQRSYRISLHIASLLYLKPVV